MITGFITTPEVARQIEAGVAQAFAARDLPQFWALAIMPICSGPHAGLTFIAADDEILSAPLRGTPPMTPADFPEFEQLIALLGGLAARHAIDEADITAPLPSP